MSPCHIPYPSASYLHHDMNSPSFQLVAGNAGRPHKLITLVQRITIWKPGLNEAQKHSPMISPIMIVIITGSQWMSMVVIVIIIIIIIIIIMIVVKKLQRWTHRDGFYVNEGAISVTLLSHRHGAIVAAGPLAGSPLWRCTHSCLRRLCSLWLLGSGRRHAKANMADDQIKCEHDHAGVSIFLRSWDQDTCIGRLSGDRKCSKDWFNSLNITIPWMHKKSH